MRSSLKKFKSLIMHDADDFVFVYLHPVLPPIQNPPPSVPRDRPKLKDYAFVLLRVLLKFM